MKIYAKFKADEGKEFKKHYRYRTKNEGLFSAMKQKYGGSVNSKTRAGAENEVLLKCLCQNVHVLLMAAEIYGLKIDGLTAPKIASVPSSITGHQNRPALYA